MKAKELAQILMKYPDLNVEFHYENLELAEWIFVPITLEGIFISEYEPDTIVLTESYYVNTMKTLDNDLVDIQTRPYKK